MNKDKGVEEVEEENRLLRRDKSRNTKCHNYT